MAGLHRTLQRCYGFDLRDAGETRNCENIRAHQSRFKDCAIKRQATRATTAPGGDDSSSSDAESGKRVGSEEDRKTDDDPTGHRKRDIDQRTKKSLSQVARGRAVTAGSRPA